MVGWDRKSDAQNCCFGLWEDSDCIFRPCFGSPALLHGECSHGCSTHVVRFARILTPAVVLLRPLLMWYNVRQDPGVYEEGGKGFPEQGGVFSGISARRRAAITVIAVVCVEMRHTAVAKRNKLLY